jgi:phosphatidylinositol alpha-1,6-mannosyltransferase
VDGTNVEEIANRAIQLLLDEKLRISMGSAGRAWIEKDWRWQIWAGKFSDLLAR